MTSLETDNNAASMPLNHSVTHRSRYLAWNLRIAWTSLSLGIVTGLIMGLWSFDGPVPVPGWLGDYGSVARRLARLGHIACFGLGILNLLLARDLPRFELSDRSRRVAAGCMNFGNIFLPTSLFLAAAYHPLKYLMPVPAMSVGAALSIAAWGAWKTREGTDDGGD